MTTCTWHWGRLGRAELALWLVPLPRDPFSASAKAAQGRTSLLQAASQPSVGPPWGQGWTWVQESTAVAPGVGRTIPGWISLNSCEGPILHVRELRCKARCPRLGATKGIPEVRKPQGCHRTHIRGWLRRHLFLPYVGVLSLHWVHRYGLWAPFYCRRGAVLPGCSWHGSRALSVAQAPSPGVSPQPGPLPLASLSQAEEA